MMTLRRSADRYHVRRRQRDVWSTFHPKVADGFETLIALNEGLIPPGASVPSLPLHDAEVITYVFEGALACKGPTGGSGVIYAGEFQRRGAVRGHRERNASRSAWARVFQISLRSSAGGLRPDRETKRFSIAQRRGVLCVIASHDGRNGSLRIQSDAQVHSAILDSGRHLAYELASESCAWLHIVAGAVQMGGVVLTTGDSAGITAEHAVSLIARDDSEILLVGIGRAATEVLQLRSRPMSGRPGSIPRGRGFARPALPALATPTPDVNASLVLAPDDASPGVPESVELLDGGEQAYPRMLAAIASSIRTVHLQVYAFAPGGVGKRFVEALALAAERSVTVEVLIDGWGSARGGRSVAAALREAGCTVRIHNRLLSLLVGRFGRNHRKVLLVDDEVAFLGGINIGDEYLGEALRVGWADLALEIRGPECMRLGQMIRGEHLRSVGGSLRIFLCGLGGGWRLRRRYLDAFASARERIHVAHGYFLPDPGVVRAITAAARRGVQVRLLLAGQSNHPLARAAARSLYPRLLSAGVSIHEWSDSVLHAKVATVDGRRLLVGSFNLDPFSLANLEALVEVDDTQVVEQGEAWIQDHFASSRVMTSVGANSRLQKWLFDPLGRLVAQLADAASRVMASHEQRKASPDHSRSSPTPHRALARRGTRAYPDSRRADVMDAPEPLGAKIRSRDRSRFSRPGEVVDSHVLTPEEKQDILLQWLEDEKALFVADDEGMQGDRPSQIDLVHRALRVLMK